MNKQQKKNRLLTSIAIILASLGLTYAPLPGLNTETTVTVVSGSELQEILPELEAKFEAENPNIDLELKYQGSQDIVNKYIDDGNDFTPTVLIPANGEIFKELESRWRSQNNSEPFYNKPEPIAKTMLVGISWPERGRVLFPNNRFEWQRLKDAMLTGNWEKIGGKLEWGSFDFLTTNPTRSNSGQLTLTLFAKSEIGGGNLNPVSLNNFQVEFLFDLVKRSVYLPPRSTDILLQEFITRGPNEADVATVYESIALHRWEQSQTTQGRAYQIYYLDPTIETVSTAAIASRNVSDKTAAAARE
ncbi:MAG: ABC transporter substrate-binding protein, partial [Okeania sp. SIO2H7]|nr:ABC transporter substrate-binding protein [Okeania sp. SIO2H7]